MHDTSSKDVKKIPPEDHPTVILMTIADTSWRMFVPSFGGTLLGVWLDGTFGTSPWLLFLGIIVGILVAVTAVILQLKKIW